MSGSYNLDADDEAFEVESGQPLTRRYVERTLAEQMRISGHELESRKRLLEITEEDGRTLHGCRRYIYERIDDIIEGFYKMQIREPEIALVIGDAETLKRLKLAMRSYIMELFAGNYDIDYVNTRLRIGKVHKRIGVSPKLYTSAISLMHRILAGELYDMPADSSDIMRQRLSALHKVILFDLQLIFDTYIASLVAELNEQRRETLRYANSLEEQVIDRTRQLEEHSRTDMLTGLTNQRGFYEHLSRECGAVARSGEPVSLAFIDLDGFKVVNDEQGHQAGDAILCAFSTLIKMTVRETDIPCRYGGDEFAIIMPRTSIIRARVIARRLIKSFEQRNIGGTAFSVGLAQSTAETCLAPDDLIRLADNAMYRAKLAGRDKPGCNVELAAASLDQDAETVVEFEPVEPAEAKARRT